MHFQFGGREEIHWEILYDKAFACPKFVCLHGSFICEILSELPIQVIKFGTYIFALKCIFNLEEERKFIGKFCMIKRLHAQNLYVYMDSLYVRSYQNCQYKSLNLGPTFLL